MRSLLVVAHGSRRQESNDEVRRLVRQLREISDDYERIESAFLELAEPSIPDGLRRLIESGSNDVVVLPYFLSAGRHVVEDIPREINIVRDEHPAVSIHVVAYLGSAPGVARLMLSQAAATPAAAVP